MLFACPVNCIDTYGGEEEGKLFKNKTTISLATYNQYRCTFVLLCVAVVPKRCRQFAHRRLYCAHSTRKKLKNSSTRFSFNWFDFFYKYAVYRTRARMRSLWKGLKHYRSVLASWPLNLLDFSEKRQSFAPDFPFDRTAVTCDFSTVIEIVFRRIIAKFYRRRERARVTDSRITSRNIV